MTIAKTAARQEGSDEAVGQVEEVAWTMKIVRRVLLTLIWGIAFMIAAYFAMAIPFAIFFLHNSPDPPTELLLMGTVLLCPLAGIIGIVLGICRKLPGTK